MSPLRLALRMMFICQLASLGAWGLRSMRILVPEAVRDGSSVRLACDYDLERAALYSIKWYHGDEEFYRYVPQEKPPTKTFKVDDIDVDVSQSNDHEVSLRNVQRALTGTYKCEVSADAPLFHTDIKSAHMTVAEVTEMDPWLSADKLEVSFGDTVHVTCRTPPSSPPANVSWYLNGEQVPQNSHSPWSPEVEWEPSSGLQVSRSRLPILINRTQFPDSELNVRCVATVFELFSRSAQLRLRINPPPPAPILGPTAPLGLSDFTGYQNSAITVMSMKSIAVVLAIAIWF